MGIDENNVYNCQRYCDLVSIVLIKSNEIHSGKKCIQNFSQVQIHGKFRNLFLYFGYKIFALGSSGHSNLCSVEAHSKVQNQVGILAWQIFQENFVFKKGKQYILYNIYFFFFNIKLPNFTFLLYIYIHYTCIYMYYTWFCLFVCQQVQIYHNKIYFYFDLDFSFTFDKLLMIAFSMKQVKTTISWEQYCVLFYESLLTLLFQGTVINDLYNKYRLNFDQERNFAIIGLM
eukprot:TRINITY_DN35644_c0_g1_i2.p1 TRINITY_DN35644_c0_g1~~TRINITY_DN35644_c0_g1_i2.p1  ORF type:complete len:230 (-),score=-16.55 TRINITY_DN35644_c0_g1_i2:191-880(-)